MTESQAETLVKLKLRPGKGVHYVRPYPPQAAMACRQGIVYELPERYAQDAAFILIEEETPETPEVPEDGKAEVPVDETPVEAPEVSAEASAEVSADIELEQDAFDV